MNTQTPFAIFSAERSEYTAEINASRTKFLARQLEQRGLNVTQVTGAYNGVEEQSFLVLLPDGDSHEVARLARRYGQESFLYVDANRFASLHYLNPPNTGGSDERQTEPLGFFVSISPADAATRPAWTRDGHGRFFAVA